MPPLKDIRAKFFANLGQKLQQTDYFQKFYFSQTSHKIDNNMIFLFLN